MPVLRPCIKGDKKNDTYFSQDHIDQFMPVIGLEVQDIHVTCTLVKLTKKVKVQRVNLQYTLSTKG